MRAYRITGFLLAGAFAFTAIPVAASAGSYTDPMISISVTPANPTIAVGALQHFKATAKFKGGATADVTALVLWQSSATKVATISNTIGSKGLATGKSAGTTTIRASLLGLVGSTSLTVTNTTTADFSLSASPSSVMVVRGASG